MKVNGECLCGACAWEAELDPKLVFLCHCEDCQVQGGSAFRSTAIAPPDHFVLKRGELSVWDKKAESGRARALAFCPTCGTHVYGGPGAGESGMLSVRVGPLAQRRELSPQGQVWCRSRLAWLDDLAAIPSNETQPGMPGGEGSEA